MRLSLPAVVVALTASILVSACSKQYDPCNWNTDCCPSYFCSYNIVSMSRPLYNQNSTTMTHPVPVIHLPAFVVDWKLSRQLERHMGIVSHVSVFASYHG
ncbi:uncharacterized protein F5891DRAFT_699729 [Suillus fuscotomentosus]|uniref:Uncharacterized protein n=1 Tax=Suillus fuscotomentosus TaxID=1912939 RepID=A0AAD4DVT8_9AGAM|nr:uncharacterized protein F5891DRAFT_699729 [Suillus fuscotomentosus]KAG1894907.1 hypothetical protein F5891DRAFT_699729 [Suillus fuscotomentosus]